MGGWFECGRGEVCPMTKHDVLESLEPLFAHSNAEGEDTKRLASCFVETDAWKYIVRGERDIFRGAKGAGKSALYLLLIERKDELVSLNNVLLVPAEEPSGNSVFEEALSERVNKDSRSHGRGGAQISAKEFSELWRLYFLVLIVARLQEEARARATVKAALRESEHFRSLVNVLVRADLLARERAGQLSIGQTLDRVLQSVKLGIKIPLVFEFKLETNPASHDPVRVSQELLPFDPFEILNGVLDSTDLQVWVLLDRLDDAFVNQSPKVEAVALNTLLQTYTKLRRHSRIRLKLFVRSDLYARAFQDMAGRFRGGEKIEGEVDINWEPADLVDIVVRRLVQSEPLRAMYGLTNDEGVTLHRDYEAQIRLSSRVFPERVADVDALAWILGRLEDGHGQVTPRALIKLVSLAIERQQKRRSPPDGELLLDDTSLREAAVRASKEYYEKAFCPEYPMLRPYANGLAGQPESNTIRTLRSLWGRVLNRNLTDEAAEKMAMDLTEAGFFAHADGEPYYRVAPLYHSALNIQPGPSTP
jgi:hypothetical protein